MVGAHRWLVEPRRPLGDEVAELYAVTNYIGLTGVVAFIAYIPLFLVLGARTFAVLNVAVALLLGGSLWMVRRGWVFAGAIFASTLVMAHSWMATMTFGWGSGFHLHIVLGLELGLLFVHVPLRVRLTFAVVVTTAYLGLMVTVQHVPPTFPLDRDWQAGVAMLNSVAFLFVTVLIATFFAWTVRKSRNRREETLRELEDRNDRLRDSEEALASARDQAEEGSRAKSMFLANMSHELRTPLNAIIGYSELIAEDAQDAGDENLADEVARIRGAGHHLLSLINDILDLSKIEAGRMDYESLDFDLAQCVAQVVETATPLAAKKDIRLVVEVEGDLGELRSDPTKVRQVLLNLLSNACKFTAEGEVELSVRREAKRGRPGVLLAVRDSGIGIAPENLEQIFDEFSQAEDSTTRKFGGTGLGLAIARRFCEGLGGSLDAQSTLGEGSTFTVWLPSKSEPVD